MRNLRAAIHPDPSPQLILPDRFRDATTELADGTIVMLDEYDRPVRLKAGRFSVGKADEEASSLDDHNNNDGAQGEAVDITVKASPPGGDVDPQQQQQQQKVLALDEPVAVVVGGDDTPEVDGASSPHDPQSELEASEPVQAQPQPAPWEVRSEDDLVEDEQAAAGAEDDGAKPLSRAARRRQIKEDIQKLAQGDTPLYYQRRLW